MSAPAATATRAANATAGSRGRWAIAHAVPAAKPASAPVAEAAPARRTPTFTRSAPSTEGVTVSVTDRPQGDHSDRTAAPTVAAATSATGAVIRPPSSMAAVTAGGSACRTCAPSLRFGARSSRRRRPDARQADGLLGPRLRGDGQALAGQGDEPVGLVAVQDRLELV